MDPPSNLSVGRCIQLIIEALLNVILIHYYIVSALNTFVWRRGADTNPSVQWQLMHRN